eukprot:3751700-Amphidinium_carterae.1
MSVRPAPHSVAGQNIALCITLCKERRQSLGKDAPIVWTKKYGWFSRSHSVVTIAALLPIPGIVIPIPHCHVDPFSLDLPL